MVKQIQFFGEIQFNKSVNLLTETKLKSINFGTYFNNSVSNLPSILESLIFNEKFNHSLDNLLINLKYLSLS